MGKRHLELFCSCAYLLPQAQGKSLLCAGCHMECTPPGRAHLYSRGRRTWKLTAGLMKNGMWQAQQDSIWEASRLREVSECGETGDRIPRQTPDVCTAPLKSYSTLRRSHYDPIQQTRTPRLIEVNMPRSHHKHGAGLLLLPVVPPPPHGPCPINQEVTNPVLAASPQRKQLCVGTISWSAPTSRRPWVSNTPCVVPTTC